MVRIRLMMVVIIAIGATTWFASGKLCAQPAEKKPIVERSPLLREPKTPEEMFAATLLMVDLGRMDLAELYLEQFEATDPDDAFLIKLRDKHGTGDFLKLARSKELQPRSTRLMEKLNIASKRQADDPAFVDALVNQLTEGPRKRDLAIIELQNAGERAVPQILRQMSKPEMAEQQDTLVIVLTRMGRQVIPPLIGAIDSPEERIRGAVIDSLRWLDATDAIPYLWFPAFDENQPAGIRIAARTALAKLLKRGPGRNDTLSSVDASNELKRLAKLLYRSPDVLPLDEQGSVSLWGWSEQEGTVVERSLTPEIASLFLSTRFARQSLALSPDQPEPQRQYLASLLGLEILRDGWEKPRTASPGTAMYLALTAGEETVSQVLAESLEAGHPATAVAALEVLSQIGTRDQLLSQSGLKSPVIAALNSPDPRVQFTAAVTVLKLDPKTGFKGSTRVVDILSRAITDPGQSRAIVIDPDNRRQSAVAGYVSDGGYEAVMASTGREGFERAVSLAGVDLIVVHANCVRWELGQTLANLRADSRSAAIPIVIYGAPEIRAQMARQVARHAPAAFATEAASSNDFLLQLAPFFKNLKSVPISPKERALQKNAAVYWLATIGSTSLSRLFDISQAEKDLSAAVEDPVVAANALVAIAAIGTGSAQRRLTDVALNPQTAENLRESAAAQLVYHIQHHGLLLTKDEVIDFHAGWKQADNPNVKSALAAVIGSLKPNATIVGERLQKFPVPAN